MKEANQSNFITHLFVCTKCSYIDNENRKQERAGLDLRIRVKKAAEGIFPKGILRVNESGCLGRCSSGINAAFYPQNRWISGIKKDDDDILLKSIEDVLVDRPFTMNMVNSSSSESEQEKSCGCGPCHCQE